jgi:phosphate transport system substrate-binding protein
MRFYLKYALLVLSHLTFPLIIRRVNRYPIFLLFAFFILISACRPTTDQPPGQEPGTTSTYIENKGSDTMVNLALAWAEYYQDLRPEVRLSVTGGGSGTGIAALINGTVDIANASRRIKQEELQAAQSRGSEPIEFVVSRDAIAVIVHLSNPIEQLSLQQISDIYSGVYTNWSQLGGEDRPIVRLSRETNSGTHVYFLEEVMRQGRPDDRTLFSRDTLLLPSAEGITAEIRENPNAIGYDGLGYVTHEMKVLAVARDENGPYVLPSLESVNNGTYPIARDLYMYTVGQPEGAVKDFMDWIFSVEAQGIIQELGFVPVVTQ